MTKAKPEQPRCKDGNHLFPGAIGSPWVCDCGEMVVRAQSVTLAIEPVVKET